MTNAEATVQRSEQKLSPEVAHQLELVQQLLKIASELNKKPSHELIEAIKAGVDVRKGDQVDIGVKLEALGIQIFDIAQPLSGNFYLVENKSQEYSDRLTRERKTPRIVRSAQHLLRRFMS